MANMREASKQNWTSNDHVEHINAGSLQRIADAVEKMASRHIETLYDLEYFKRHYEERGKTIATLENRIRALKGWVTRKSKGYN